MTDEVRARRVNGDVLTTAVEKLRSQHRQCLSCPWKLMYDEDINELTQMLVDLGHIIVKDPRPALTPWADEQLYDIWRNRTCKKHFICFGTACATYQELATDLNRHHTSSCTYWIHAILREGVRRGEYLGPTESVTPE